MGPHLHENNNINNMRDVEENNDGWRIGFDVQIQGIGIDHLHDDEATSNAAASDGDDEIDGDSVYSHDNDNNNDAENADTIRAGYRPLQFNITESSQEDIIRALDTSPVSLQDEFRTPDMLAVPNGWSLNLPPLPNDGEQTFAIPHKPVDIALNYEKICEIKTTMSQLEITPPPWALTLKDETLTELVRKLKNSL